MLKITIGEYNSLFAKAEVGFEKLLNELGMNSEEVNRRSDEN